MGFLMKYPETNGAWYFQAVVDPSFVSQSDRERIYLSRLLGLAILFWVSHLTLSVQAFFQESDPDQARCSILADDVRTDENQENGERALLDSRDHSCRIRPTPSFADHSETSGSVHTESHSFPPISLPAKAKTCRKREK